MVTSVALSTRSFVPSARASAEPKTSATANASEAVWLAGRLTRDARDSLFWAEKFLTVHLIQSNDVAVFIFFSDVEDSREHDGHVLDGFDAFTLHRDHDVFVHVGNVSEAAGGDV